MFGDALAQVGTRHTCPQVQSSPMFFSLAGTFQGARRPPRCVPVPCSDAFIPFSVLQKFQNRCSWWFISICHMLAPGVVQSWSSGRLRRELLVGFDPVPLLVAELEARFDHLAVFFADYVGGDFVGVKWRPAALAPGPLRVAHADTVMPATAEPNGNGFLATPGVGKRRAGADAASSDVFDVVPDLPAVLVQMKLLGVGLVDDVLVCSGKR
jgi:Nrap protein domain 6